MKTTLTLELFPKRSPVLLWVLLLLHHHDHDPLALVTLDQLSIFLLPIFCNVYHLEYRLKLEYTHLIILLSVLDADLTMFPLLTGGWWSGAPTLSFNKYVSDSTHCMPFHSTYFLSYFSTSFPGSSCQRLRRNSQKKQS